MSLRVIPFAMLIELNSFEAAGLCTRHGRGQDRSNLCNAILRLENETHLPAQSQTHDGRHFSSLATSSVTLLSFSQPPSQCSLAKSLDRSKRRRQARRGSSVTRHRAVPVSSHGRPRNRPSKVQSPSTSISDVPRSPSFHFPDKLHCVHEVRNLKSTSPISAPSFAALELTLADPDNGT